MNQPNKINYCINPGCHSRENAPGEMICGSCGTSLLVEGRYRLLFPLRKLELYSPTEVFEVLDELDSIRPRKILKILKTREAKWLELFEREALVLQTFVHPGLPRADFDSYFSVSPNQYPSQIECLILEKVPGINLEKWSETQGKLSQKTALNWLQQLIEIVGQLHQLGFFHRDIKPSNIIVRPDGQLTLIDFGAVREITDTYLMKVSGGSGETTGSRFDLTVVSTACYAPLEQINGKALPQSDFYAIGRTLVRLITGIPLVNLAEDPKDGRLLWRDNASHIAKPVADYLDELMSLLPGNRPQSAQVILQYLKMRLPLLLRMDKILKSQSFRVGVLAAIIAGAVGLYQGGKVLAARYFFDRGSEHQLTSELPLARYNYERAVAINPDNPIAHNNLALVCQDQGDVSCSFFHYNEAFRLNPNYWAAHYNLGNLYDDRRDYLRAIEQYQTVIASGSSLAVDAANNLSRIKNIQGHFGEAVVLVKQNLLQTDDPISQAALYKNLGWAELGLRRYTIAEAYLERSIQLDKERADSYCLLAQVKESEKKPYEASQLWESCIRNSSSLPEVQEWRSAVLKRLKSSLGN